MFALFYDRVDGANVYSNLVFYQTSPPLTSSRQTFTPEQRDAPTSGFSRFPIPSLLDASGRVENYRQPYVDQSVLSLEKSFGARWKAEVVYTNRRNGDIVGLVDRNMFTNYTLISNVSVEHRYVRGAVLDADGNRLVIPFVYASNKDIQDYMAALAFRRQLRDTLFGYPTSYLRTLKWNPEVVLTSVDDARRRYDQVTVLVRTVQPMWRVDASLTGAQLRGNVPGVTGYGTTATRFSAGPFVNPNESFNMHGHLPDALQLEGKVWLTARLPHALHGGLLYTHTLGERFTPSFPLEGRYVYRYRETTPIGDEVFRQSFGQSILLEPRGSRNYASRAVVDAHLEWRSPRRAVLTLDLFNAFAENEAVSVKTTVEDQFAADPTTRFGAVRMRVAPRTLRIGFRLE